jgi:hypothetical protein
MVDLALSIEALLFMLLQLLTPLDDEDDEDDEDDDDELSVDDDFGLDGLPLVVGLDLTSVFMINSMWSL